jgi:hypothetical protein
MGVLLLAACDLNPSEGLAPLNDAPSEVGNVQSGTDLTVLDSPRASALAEKASDAHRAMRFEEALGHLTDLQQLYPTSYAAIGTRSLQHELSVIGTTAPKLSDEGWIQGRGGSLATGTTVILFWEPWCRHSRIEAAKLTSLTMRWSNHDLEVIGITRMTRGATDETVATFLRDAKVEYPIALDQGALSDAFAVSGVPAAAVVRDGVIVWRGIPRLLTDDLVAVLMGAGVAR